MRQCNLILAVLDPSRGRLQSTERCYGKQYDSYFRTQLLIKSRIFTLVYAERDFNMNIWEKKMYKYERDTNTFNF